MDDAGAAAALPAVGDVGDRQRATDNPAGCTLVFTLAVREMARRQRSLSGTAEDAALLSAEMRIAAIGTAAWVGN